MSSIHLVFQKEILRQMRGNDIHSTFACSKTFHCYDNETSVCEEAGAGRQPAKELH